MISAEMLIFIIASFCQFKSTHVTKTEKIECAEFMSNCSIKQNGETTNKIVNACKEEWADQEVKRRSGR